MALSVSSAFDGGNIRAVAIEGDVVVAGVRPVTDTVKAVDTGVLGETVDRAGLLAVTSPVVLPASVVTALGTPPPGAP